MKIKKRIFSLALAGVLTLGLLPAFSSPALAADGDTNTYTVTIPSELTVNDKGWNEITGGIKAKGTLESGKKLTVTATSTTNSYKLKSGDNEIGYNLAKTGDSNSTYSASAEVPKWEFAELQANEDTTLTAGIIVEDYSSKPAGTYTDTVTFTAKVEDAAIVYPFGFSKQAWWGNPETGEIDVPANFVSVSQTDAKAAADAEKTSANAPGYVCIYALEGGQYKWIDSHGRTGQNSNLLDIANGDAWEEVYECHNAGDVNSIWFTVNK